MAYVVGITGGIGSGKSAVTSRLEQHGIVIVDADEVARQVVEPGRSVLREIEDYFGAEAILPDGSLDRVTLRQYVFEDPAKRKWLEALIHPKIHEEVGRQIAAADSIYVVLSSPLLLETGQRAFTHYVVVVDVPEDIQIERVVKRDNYDEVLIRNIMAAQMARAERCEQADEVIDNTGTLGDLFLAVDELNDRITMVAECSS